jgi:AraC family transcriptional regulator
MEEYRRPPGEEREGAPTHHMLALNIGAPYRREVSWADQQGVVRHSFESGRTLILPAAVGYRVRWLDAAHVLILQIDPALLLEAAEAAGRDVARGVQLRRELNARDEFVSHVMLALRDVLNEGGGQARIYGEHLAMTVAMHLVSRYAANPPGRAKTIRGGLPMNRMRRVLEHVDASLEAPLSLSDLARVANMSVFHFARLFKARPGVPPHQYVLRKRIDRAKHLLHDAALSIAEIAVRCGFSHQPHFTKAFHQIAGVTPTDWRDRAV